MYATEESSFLAISNSFSIPRGGRPSPKGAGPLSNLAVVGRATVVPLSLICEHVIGPPLQQEGHGGRLQTLEVVIHVRNRALELELKDKTALNGKPNPGREIVCYPDVFALNAKSTLRSLVAALAKKCVF